MIDETDFINAYSRHKDFGGIIFKNWLIETILEAKEAYYGSGDAFITDDTYDAIERDLKKIDPQHPVVQMVGYDEKYHEDFVNGEVE